MNDTMRRLFSFLDQRKRAYQLTFQLNQPANVLVLQDLAKFCRATESTFHPDARLAANLDGRREVFLRIQNHLGLTTEQLLSIYGGDPLGAIQQGERK